MKRFMLIVSVVAVLSVVLAACGGGTEPVTQEPATQPPATEPPALTEAPIVSTIPAVQPVDLAGPPMEVGSKFVYIDGSVLVAVPGGPFIMGYNYADNPEREVSVSDFWIYNSEVTNQQYALCVNAGKCAPPDRKDNPNFENYRFINYPVTGVTHQQAVDYCTFVHGRLPTEAEWEKAARGPEGNIFPWGNESPSCDLLNYDFCRGKALDIQSYPKGVSYYGLFDMSGNIREWAADWYLNTYFQTAPGEDPLGPELGEKRAVRSSSYEDGGDFSVSAHRASFRPDESLPDLGFRCVVEDPTYFAPFCEQVAYIGAGPDGSEANCTPEVVCNDVNVTQAIIECQIGETPFTNVTFSVVESSPPSGWSYDQDGCDPQVGDTYTCEPGDGPVSVTGGCTDVSSCDPTCPMHYTLDGDVCKWDGSGTTGERCIEGYTYDSDLQCCSATPGSGIDFNICPSGFYPLNGVCVPDPTGIVDSMVLNPVFDSCNPEDTPCDPATDPNCQPGSCTQGPPANGCPRDTTGKQLVWNPVTCKCE